MKNLAILSTPWPPVLLNKPQENICLLQRGQHQSSARLRGDGRYASTSCWASPWRCWGGSGGISLHPPSFLLLWGMACSNRAETWLEKALFALPFSLQLPHLAAQDRRKLCRESETQEQIRVFSFSTLSPWKEQNIIYKTGEMVIKKQPWLSRWYASSHGCAYAEWLLSLAAFRTAPALQ